MTSQTIVTEMVTMVSQMMTHTAKTLTMVLTMTLVTKMSQTTNSFSNLAFSSAAALS